MSPPETESIPAWAANMRETVARIDERTQQIGHVVSMVEHLQKTSVPLSSHEYLMTTVRELEKRDTGARSQWEEMVPRVDTLWEERSEAIGGRAFRRTAVGFLAVVLSLATLYNLLHGAGLVTLGPH